jgi:hypothetical protein
MVLVLQAIAEDLCERAHRVVAVGLPVSGDAGAAHDVLLDMTLLTRAFWLFETLASYVGLRVVVRSLACKHAHMHTCVFLFWSRYMHGGERCQKPMDLFLLSVSKIFDQAAAHIACGDVGHLYALK